MWYTKVSLLFFAKSNYDLSNEWGILAVRQLDSKTPDKCVWIVVYLNLQLLFLYLFIKDHRWCFATSSQSMCAQATLQPSAHADRPGRPNRQVNCPFMNNNKYERNNNINTTLFFRTEPSTVVITTNTPTFCSISPFSISASMPSRKASATTSSHWKSANIFTVRKICTSPLPKRISRTHCTCTTTVRVDSRQPRSMWNVHRGYCALWCRTIICFLRQRDV